MRFFNVFILGVLLFASCGNPILTGSEEVNDTIIVSEETNLDSLLKKTIRPSEMELPILWTDTIYDTCHTHYSVDGKYTVFVGRTEEDKMLKDEHVTPYGLVSFEERQSVFLHDNEQNTITLLLTTSPEGYGLYMPQIDIKNERVYYLRDDDYIGRSFMRYNLKTQEKKCLTGCFYTTVYKLLPNGNILFQDVREDVLVTDTSLLNEDKIGFMGYVYCDIEMTPKGICVNKSRYFDYEDIDTKTGKTFDVSWTHILNNINYKPRWNPTDIGDFNDFYDKKGHCVGSTNNCIESYDGWNELKQTRQK